MAHKLVGSGDSFRISLNQKTTEQWSLEDAVRAYAATDGVEGIGLWPDKVKEAGGAKAARRLIDDTMLTVTSLTCKAEFPADVPKSVGMVRHALDDAQTLGALHLLLVTGPRQADDWDGSRGLLRVREGLETLTSDVRASGVKIVVEPAHPVEVALEATIVSLAQGAQLIAPLPPDAFGLVFDTWNGWWEDLRPALKSARGRIALLQLGDAQTPSQDEDWINRCAIGQGIIPISALVQQARTLGGFAGPWVEIEIVNPQLDPSEYSPLLTDCVAGTRVALRQTGQ